MTEFEPDPLDLDPPEDEPKLARSFLPSVGRQLFHPKAARLFIEENPSTPWGESTIDFLRRFIPGQDGEVPSLRHTLLSKYSSLRGDGHLPEAISRGWIPRSELFALLEHEFLHENRHAMSPFMGSLVWYLSSLEQQGFLLIEEVRLSEFREDRMTCVALNPNERVEDLLRQLAPDEEGSRPWSASPEESSFIRLGEEMVARGSFGAVELLGTLAAHDDGISYSALLKIRGDFSFQTKEDLESLLDAGVSAKAILRSEEGLYSVSKGGLRLLDEVSAEPARLARIA